MLNRITIATFCALLVSLFAVSTASAVPDRPASPPPTDYWQDMGFILMAHQGGEWDFPPNTLFSYKSAMALGADMIDMDAYVTRDGKLVLTHDLDARKNSNLTDGMFEGRHDINDLDLAELKTLDFAYKWKPRADPPANPPFRGIATGTDPDNPPPAGYTRDDFKIPTFDEVLAAFPDTPINIELKQVAGVEIDDTTAEMASILAAHPGHDENVIINSFGQEMLESMHAARPQHKSFSGSLNGSLSYVQGKAITPTPVAIEPPDLYQLAAPPVAPTRTVPLLKPFADYDGYKIFVWGSDLDEAQDTDPFYAKLIADGADSYNTPDPIALAAYLCTAGIASPDGSPRCPEQICPEGTVGIAPNCNHGDCPEGTTGFPPDCVDIPACPPNMTGTPPNCMPDDICPAVLRYGKGRCEVDRTARVKKLRFVHKKGKLKAGKKIKLTLKITNSPGVASKATIRLKSSSRKVKLPKKVTVRLKYSSHTRTTRKTIKVRATRRARGKVRITAASGAAKTVNPLYVSSTHEGSNPLHTN